MDVRSRPAWSRIPGLEIHRRDDGRVVAGLAGGIAERLGVEVVYVRAGFLVLALVWGLGVVLYLGGWAATLDQHGDPEVVPEATGEQRLGLLAAFVGGLLVVRAVGLWPGDQLMWPALAVAFGTAVLLDRQEIDSRSAIVRLFDPGGGSLRTRTLVGILLLVAGLGLFLSSAVPQVGTVMLAVLITGVGAVVLFGPWVWRLGTDLGRERRERIRQEERAEMAAHLHDSVLQTLALIQRTDDPRRVTTLARAQERELRRWLYESSPHPGGDLLSTVLRAAADRVEADFDVRIELVTVGDVPVDTRLGALAGAAGEALTNAAKHAGVDRISLYSEVGADGVEVWISDQGRGFDPGGVDGDRRGLSQSIQARMARHGGSASVMSRPGEGTEVRLAMPLEVTGA